MNQRKLNQISVLPPLQRDTALMIANSYILGGLKEKIDVVGTAFGALVTVARPDDNVRVYPNTLRFTCTEAKKFTVTNADDVVLGTFDTTSAPVVISSVQGLTFTIPMGLTGVVAGDIVDVYIYGDSTYIIPGTILGRIKDTANVNFGKYEPIKSVLTGYDILRVCGGTVETDKTRLLAPSGNTMIVDDKLTTDVYVFAEVIEEACKLINLTDAAKAKITGIVWR